jgi:multiple RNA-binding domain-containing protein 1
MADFDKNNPEGKYRENEGTGHSKYGREKEALLKTNFDDETNWNYLFMNQDTVASSMAKKLSQTKGEFMLEGNTSMAVKVAKSETIIIN